MARRASKQKPISQQFPQPKNTIAYDDGIGIPFDVGKVIAPSGETQATRTFRDNYPKLVEVLRRSHVQLARDDREGYIKILKRGKTIGRYRPATGSCEIKSKVRFSTFDLNQLNYCIVNECPLWECPKDLFDHFGGQHWGNQPLPVEKASYNPPLETKPKSATVSPTASERNEIYDLQAVNLMLAEMVEKLTDENARLLQELSALRTTMIRLNANR